jgi:hypothetical protein
MKMLIDNRRCVIQAYELDDITYSIEDRVSRLYFHIGVEFEESMVYQEVRYYFDKKELVFSDSQELLSENIELFIDQHYKEIIEKILAWDSDYSRSLELKDNDIVLIKKTFVIATITGVYMSKDYFEVDHDEESYHHRDELVLWDRGGRKE